MPGGGHGRHPLRGGPLQMVRRPGSQTGGQGSASLVGELVGVKPQAQPGLPPGSQDPLALRRSEGDLVAEGVHGIGQPLRCRPGDHLLADQVDVGHPGDLRTPGGRTWAPRKAGLDLDRSGSPEPPSPPGASAARSPSPSRIRTSPPRW